ncbi:hypothetical protein NEMIN01_0855 [Nematocida minor]|uniref:uncharacterized protein n=1 Tax=Nematocida minor TaxID=1912983 RepID=UPI00221F3623|nr:uncharacterized protein NEMIN01_0855 [Nematocida minor]KAI5190070.1 hypothetical protein NEMIN01_0855 [Nematocida minor]
MRYHLLLYVCFSIVCRCEMGKEAAARLMMSRLAHIRSLLKSTLDDGTMKDSSALSNTLKKLSKSYNSTSSKLKRSANSQSKRKDRLLSEEESAYQPINDSKAAVERVKTRRSETIDDEDDETSVKKKEYRHTRRAKEEEPIEEERTIDDYPRESDYESDRRGTYTARRSSNDRYKDSPSRHSSYETSHGRGSKGSRRYEDEYSEETSKALA